MRRGLVWVVGILLLALVGAAGYRWLSTRQAGVASGPAQAASAAAAVVAELANSDVTLATVRPLAQGLPISGSLRSANTAWVKARVAGELQGMNLREGDSVKAGQVLGRIDPTEYQSRVRQAREQAEAARAQIDIAQRQWDNNKALVDQGFISRTALDTSQANLAAAQSNHKAALAAVEVAGKALEDTVLRAPIAGQVAQRIAQPGERVAVDGRVIEIVDLSRMEMEASLSAADSLGLRIGQSAQLRIEGAAQPVAARVVRINPSAQSASRSVTAYLLIQQPQGLRQGLFAQGQLDASAQQVLSVPLTAVRTDKPAPYVQLLENQRVQHRPVRLGLRGDVGGELMVQVEGIAEGAQVLAGHVGVLREGVPVRFTRSAAAAPPQAAASGK